MAVTSMWPIKGRVDKVINYARNPEYKGFYAHTSYGKTILEENVSVISDDSFVWLLMGKTNRPFAKVLA